MPIDIRGWIYVSWVCFFSHGVCRRLVDSDRIWNRDLGAFASGRELECKRHRQARSQTGAKRTVRNRPPSDLYRHVGSGLGSRNPERRSSFLPRNCIDGGWLARKVHTAATTRYVTAYVRAFSATGGVLKLVYNHPPLNPARRNPPRMYGHERIKRQIKSVR